MNLFAVDWAESAEMELVDIWLRAANPAAVTRASARIEYLLAHDPINYGQYLSEGLFKLCEIPLKVFYEVDQINRKVSVSDAIYLP